MRRINSLTIKSLEKYTRNMFYELKVRMMIKFSNSQKIYKILQRPQLLIIKSNLKKVRKITKIIRKNKVVNKLKKHKHKNEKINNI
jgi:hypothetical protein